MPDVESTSKLAEFLPGIAYGIAAAVAGGVSGALRHGSRITALEAKIAKLDAAVADTDKVREKLRLYKAADATAPRLPAYSGPNLMADDVLHRMIVAEMATPLSEIRAVSAEMGRLRDSIAADARIDQQRWSEFDRLVGRFGQALKQLDDSDKG